jgi:Tol biopolymer transport system component
LIGAILHMDPTDISTLQPMSPPVLDRVVKMCLAKEAERRWQTAHDLGVQLLWISEGALQVGVPALVDKRLKTRKALALALSVMALAGLGLAVFSLLRFSTPAEDIHPVRFSIAPPGNTTFDTGSIAAPFLTISPDGKHVAFLAGESGKDLSIWVRSLDSLDARPLQGTEQADGDYPAYPFWSGDSKSIAFTADHKLKRIDISGGSVQTIAALPPGVAPIEGRPNEFGVADGAWNKDGTILFSSVLGGLMRVSANGGEPLPVTTVDSSLNETMHRHPSFLPDGRHFLYIAQPGNTIYIGSLDSKHRKLLLTADSRAIYAPPGYVLFVRQGSLMAQRFDLKRLALTGDSFVLAEGVRFSALSGRAAFSVSDDGRLVYRTGAGSTNLRAIWINRNGEPGDAISQSGNNALPNISPDGKRLIVARTATYGSGSADLWIIDLVRGTNERLTFDENHDESFPVWSPDGNEIVFRSNKEGRYNLYRKPSSGSGEEKLLLKPDQAENITGVYDWSSDGHILYTSSDAKGNKSIWTVSLAAGPKAEVFLKSAHNEDQPHFSPDGRWVAYMSNESGGNQIYVRPFPAAGGKTPVSLQGGIQPRWHPNGKELFFLDRNKLMAVDIKADPIFEVGKPRVLFEVPGAGPDSGNTSNPYATFAVTPDGRFLFTRRDTTQSVSSPLTVVLHWAAGFKP